MGYDWGKDKPRYFGGWAGSMDSEKMLHWLYEAGGAELWKQYRLEKYGLISIPVECTHQKYFYIQESQ